MAPAARGPLADAHPHQAQRADRERGGVDGDRLAGARCQATMTPASAGPATLATLRVSASSALASWRRAGRDGLRDQAVQGRHESAAAVP